MVEKINEVKLDLISPKEAMNILMLKTYGSLYSYVEKGYINGYIGKNNKYKFDRAELLDFYTKK